MILEKQDGTKLVLKKYPQPKRAAEKTVIINGKEVPVRQTGGGKFPVYSYMILNEESLYVKAELTKGETLKLVADAPKPKAEAPKQEAPKQDKKPATKK